MDDPQLTHHRRQNLQTREAWRWFAPHRERVRQHLTSRPGHWLAILGAGNCNDLDLTGLLGHFRQISLFDLDHRATHRAVCQQVLKQADRDRIEVIQADVVEMSTEADASLPQFEVVASTCLLSQILHYAQLGMSGEAEAHWPQIEALRREHLALLLKMTTPGGTALLFNDFLSSDTCPRLATCPDQQLPQLLQEELSRQNFFTGLHPLAIERVLANWAPGGHAIAEHGVTSPWRWQLGAERSYAVCLHRIRKAG